MNAPAGFVGIDVSKSHLDVHSRPDVAVLHSYASMAYNNDLPWQSAILVEQALIQNHVPFDIIFDDQLRDPDGVVMDERRDNSRPHPSSAV